MKKNTLAVGLMACATIPNVRAQALFQNLNFEEANPVSAGVPSEPYLVTAASAFPDWTIYCGSVQQTEVFQNNISTGQAVADIFGPTALPPILTVPGIIDGNYSAGLQAGANLSTGGTISTSLEQTALVPAGDQSMEFKAWQLVPGTLGVSINGNNLPLITLQTTANYTLYGVDISAFAGQTGTLAFTAFQPSGLSLVELDDITFSTQSTPEPSPAILTALGGLIFAVFRRRIPWR
jgi:hypothetical protein